MSHHRIVKRIRPNHHMVPAEREGSCACCATRNEKLRCLAKSRREQEGEQLILLADLLPFPTEVKAKLDKVGILRLAVAYLKAKHLVRKGTKKYLAAPSMKEAQIMLNTLDGFLIVVNHDGQIIFISDQVTTCLGFQSYEMVGGSILEFVCPADYHILIKNCKKKASKQNPSTDVTFDSMDTDEVLTDIDDDQEEDQLGILDQQREFVIRMKYKIVQNDKGKQTGFIPIQWSGKRKKLEIGSRQRTSKCLGMVAICRPIMATFMEIDISEKTFVVRYSANHLLTYVDDRITRFLGYDPSELLGSCLIDYYHPEDFQKVIRHFAIDMWDKGSNVTEEFRVANKNGEWVWVQSHGAVVYGPRREPLFAILITHLTNHDEPSRQGKIFETGKFNNNTLKEVVAAESEVDYGQCKHRGRHVCLKFQMEREYGCRPPTPDTAPASHIFSTSPNPNNQKAKGHRVSEVRHALLSPRKMSTDYKQPSETIKKVQAIPARVTSVSTQFLRNRPDMDTQTQEQKDRFSLLHDLLRKKHPRMEEETHQSRDTIWRPLSVKEISGDVSLKDLLASSHLGKVKKQKGEKKSSNPAKPSKKDDHDWVYNVSMKQKDINKARNMQVPRQPTNIVTDVSSNQVNTSNMTGLQESKKDTLCTIDLSSLPDDISSISIKEEPTSNQYCMQMESTDNQVNQSTADFPFLTNTVLDSNGMTSTGSDSCGTRNTIAQPIEGPDLCSLFQSQLGSSGFYSMQEDSLAFPSMDIIDSPSSVRTGSTTSDSGFAVTPSPNSDMQGTPSPMSAVGAFDQQFMSTVEFSNSIDMAATETLVVDSRNEILNNIFQINCSTPSFPNTMDTTEGNVPQITSTPATWMTPGTDSGEHSQLNTSYEKLDSNNQSSSQQFTEMYGPLPNLTLNDIDQTFYMADHNNDPQEFPSLTEKLLETPPVATSPTTTESPFFPVSSSVMQRNHMTGFLPCDVDNGDSLRYLLVSRDQSRTHPNAGR